MVLRVLFPYHFTQSSSLNIQNPDHLSQTELRRFKSIYGVSPSICTVLWDKIYDIIPPGSHPHHLLYGLRFLKTYSTESVSACAEGCTEKTFREWSWIMINCLADADVVRY